MISQNSAFEEAVYYEYLKDPDSVSQQWREYFEKNRNLSNSDQFSRFNVEAKSNVIIDKKSEPAIIPLNADDESEPLSSISSKISKNMEDSLEIPTATSVRAIPVKSLDENRRIINKYLLKMKRQKISFTHLLSWALVKALIKYPNMNSAFISKDGVPNRIKRSGINIGLAIDITKKDGTRLLLVPNIKNVQDILFSDYIEKFDEMISKARNNKLSVDDLQGTTVTLTNPGMIGTTSSIPRLMNGQGLIIATGSIDYPTEFQAVRPEVMTMFAISKVVTITSTYDHRIIQGAESAEFLAYLHKLLIGEERFYDQIFASLKIPFEPIRWSLDNSIINNTGRIDEQEAIEKGAHVMLMINAYRVRGHLLASINPLGFESYYYPELDPAYYGFTIWDLDRYFHADDSWDKNNLPLRDIIEVLRDTYCGSIGIEYMHIQDPEKKEWVKKTLELRRNSQTYTIEEKHQIWQKLVKAEIFENFLHTKFVGSKRFSLEGAESMVVMLDQIFESSANDNLHSIVLGMAHRGRLNVLVNNIGKPEQKVFDEFDGLIDPESYHGSGDVKYHLGEEGVFVSSKGKKINAILSPNPSHLELVNPVIEGMARAIDNQIKDKTYTQALPILIHGDSAFAGQGIVAETLNLSQLDAYKTGGTIHIVINNQIGFTTTAQAARSSIYCTDIAKMIQVPILHVNGNDPEAVCTTALFAYEYRQKFHTDIIIDMLCYRKYGHNESDEPSYTQPLLYKRIKSMPAVSKIYQNELFKESVLTEKEVDNFIKSDIDRLNDLFSARTTNSNATIIPNGSDNNNIVFDTKIDNDSLVLIAKAISSVPKKIKINPKLNVLLRKRGESIEAPAPAIDWATAEAFAFGSILLEGKEIRFSGQDTRRGTFSQRHAVLIDSENENSYTPLNNIKKGQAKLRIWDSPLSEIAVLGFEYGYSLIAKNSLTLWEAQFGDFANGAQAIVDQFISCAESKWGKHSNLVILLPHSYDGQGPEHSSGRVERYLQLCADNNMIVCNITTPSNYFHALRRQVIMKPGKPMIIMTPKGMLRHPLAVSSANDLTSGSFLDIIDSTNPSPAKVKKIVLSTGKIYYDMIEKLDKNRTDIALIRVEQIYPLNTELLEKLFRKYSSAKEIFWVQEEPKNMGAWSFIAPRISEILNGQKLSYCGRKESAATATGSLKMHIQEQKEIIDSALKSI